MPGAALALALLVAGCSGDDAATSDELDAAATTIVIDPPRTAPLPSGLDGFTTSCLTVTAAGGGDGRRLCVAVADTEAKRQRGLQGVTDLGGLDGMLFRFGRPSTVRFWMFQTPTPLSIAFYDEGGRFVSSTDMAPCTSTDPAACPTYGAASPYTDAVEVLAGRLDDLGLVAGSTLRG